MRRRLVGYGVGGEAHRRTQILARELGVRVEKVGFRRPLAQLSENVVRPESGCRE
jgi:hypothetical protein